MPSPAMSSLISEVSALPSRTATRTLHIDWTRCDGHGTCADLLPDLISRDEWGYPVVMQDVEISTVQVSRAELAVEVCPMLALRLSTGG